MQSLSHISGVPAAFDPDIAGARMIAKPPGGTPSIAESHDRACSMRVEIGMLFEP
jgi:hypothetical protein